MEGLPRLDLRADNPIQTLVEAQLTRLKPAALAFAKALKLEVARLLG